MLLASFRGQAVDPLVGLRAGEVRERLAEAGLQALDAVLAPPLDGQRLQEIHLALARLATPLRGGRASPPARSGSSCSAGAPWAGALRGVLPSPADGGGPARASEAGGASSPSESSSRPSRRRSRRRAGRGPSPWSRPSGSGAARCCARRSRGSHPLSPRSACRPPSRPWPSLWRRSRSTRRGSGSGPCLCPSVPGCGPRQKALEQARTVYPAW